MLYPPFLSLFSLLASGKTLGGYFVLGTDSCGADYIIAALFGGALIGIGCALSFLGGGSSGGTDIFALIICKICPKARLPHVIFITDALVILLGAAAVRNFTATLTGIFSAFTAALMLERILKNS